MKSDQVRPAGVVPGGAPDLCVGGGGHVAGGAVHGDGNELRVGTKSGARQRDDGAAWPCEGKTQRGEVQGSSCFWKISGKSPHSKFAEMVAACLLRPILSQSAKKRKSKKTKVSVKLHECRMRDITRGTRTI